VEGSRLLDDRPDGDVTPYDPIRPGPARPGGPRAPAGRPACRRPRWRGGTRDRPCPHMITRPARGRAMINTRSSALPPRVPVDWCPRPIRCLLHASTWH